MEARAGDVNHFRVCAWLFLMWNRQFSLCDPRRRGHATRVLWYRDGFDLRASPGWLCRDGCVGMAVSELLCRGTVKCRVHLHQSRDPSNCRAWQARVEPLSRSGRPSSAVSGGGHDGGGWGFGCAWWALNCYESVASRARRIRGIAAAAVTTLGVLLCWSRAGTNWSLQLTGFAKPVRPWTLTTTAMRCRFFPLCWRAIQYCAPSVA